MSRSNYLRQDASIVWTEGIKAFIFKVFLIFGSNSLIRVIFSDDLRTREFHRTVGILLENVTHVSSRLLLFLLQVQLKLRFLNGKRVQVELHLGLNWHLLVKWRSIEFCEVTSWWLELLVKVVTKVSVLQRYFARCLLEVLRHSIIGRGIFSNRHGWHFFLEIKSGFRVSFLVVARDGEGLI